jgi:2-polyprenyl-6-methoxyphenol hydroxylase-like FAD-dependent oxidoreductase
LIARPEGGKQPNVNRAQQRDEPPIRPFSRLKINSIAFFTFILTIVTALQVWAFITSERAFVSISDISIGTSPILANDPIQFTVRIPPPLIRRDPIAAMRAAAEQLLAPQFRAIVRLIDEPMLQPIYDPESPRLALGRVAIVGDAAFVARPHVAAGVSKAADDAAALAEALDGDDVEAALRRFETQRLPENKKIIERARHLGAYLQATQTAEERTRSARHGIPEAVLAETAVLDFLYG